MIRGSPSSRSWPVKPGRIPMLSGYWRPVQRTIAGERLFLCTAKGLGFLYGLPEAPIESVELRDCLFAHRAEPDPSEAKPAMTVHMRPSGYPTCGLYAADMCGPRLVNCELRPRHGQPLVTERTTHES